MQLCLQTQAAKVLAVRGAVWAKTCSLLGQVHEHIEESDPIPPYLISFHLIPSYLNLSHPILSHRAGLDNTHSLLGHWATGPLGNQDCKRALAGVKAVAGK